MKSPRLSVFLSIFFIIILFITLHYVGALKSTEHFLRHILSPISRFIYSSSVSLKEKSSDLSEDPEKQVQKLEEDLLICKVESKDVKNLQEENAELRSQLTFFQANNFSHIGAEVIGRNIQPLGNTLVINRGSKDGVQVGNAVIISNGVLIGKIAQAEEESSMVRLLSDNQSKIAATILNREKSIGVIEGGYGISIRMNFIPQQEDVRVGDQIITSGLETGMPRGLLIGNIAAIEKEAYEPFQTAVLNPAASLSALSVVSIITSIERSL